MTRSNLNFIYQNPGEAPRTLFHYHNGDQYPEGLLQYFGLANFLTIDHLWTPDDFRIWIRKNYTVACRKITTLPSGFAIDAHAQSDERAEPEDLGIEGQPKIYYTDGWITDYSYVFTHRRMCGRARKDGSRRYAQQNWVSVWNYQRLIFDGSAKRFLRFCEKRVRAQIVFGDAAAMTVVGAALTSALS